MRLIFLAFAQDCPLLAHDSHLGGRFLEREVFAPTVAKVNAKPGAPEDAAQAADGFSLRAIGAAWASLCPGVAQRT